MNRTDQLRSHLALARQNGVTEQELIEAITHLAFYAGWPSADHGSSDGDIFRVIRRGLPPTMMPGYDERIPDPEIWNVVNYLRSLRQGR